MWLVTGHGCIAGGDKVFHTTRKCRDNCAPLLGKVQRVGAVSSHSKGTENVFADEVINTIFLGEKPRGIHKFYWYLSVAGKWY